MSDTKALERALNLVLENDVLCASYGGVFREAAAELAELRAENTEMRETLADLVVMIADFAHLLPQGAKIAFENAAAVLAKHPEEKK